MPCNSLTNAHVQIDKHICPVLKRTAFLGYFGRFRGQQPHFLHQCKGLVISCSQVVARVSWRTPTSSIKGTCWCTRAVWSLKGLDAVNGVGNVSRFSAAWANSCGAPSLTKSAAPLLSRWAISCRLTTALLRLTPTVRGICMIYKRMVGRLSGLREVKNQMRQVRYTAVMLSSHCHVPAANIPPSSHHHPRAEVILLSSCHLGHATDVITPLSSSLSFYCCRHAVY